MNKVTIINLNGKAYHLEEKGYEALHAYLDQAAAKLAENPDKEELMADFEQAIAEKCDHYLSHHKNIVTAEEIEAILKKIGPVENNTDSTESSSTTNATSTSSTATPKRLYRITKGKWVAGVCTGLGAYFDINVELIRIAFLILTVFSHGFGILLYSIMWIVLPTAHTNDEVAEAYGIPPFSAQEFINRAKIEYEKFDASHDRHEWKKNMREMKKKWRNDWRAYNHSKPYREQGGRLARIMATLLGLLSLALLITWIVAIVEFVQRGMVFGHVFGAGEPMWISLLFITSIFAVINSVLKTLKREAQEHAWNIPDYYHGRTHGASGLWFVIAAGFLVYTSVHLFPAVHDYWQMAVNYLTSIKH